MTADTVLREFCCNEEREVASASRKDVLRPGDAAQLEACLLSMHEALVPVITTTENWHFSKLQAGQTRRHETLSQEKSKFKSDFL